jgi:hypothetical protein
MKAVNTKALKMQALLSGIIMVVGVLLMTFTIYTESEPGALPLFLVLGSTIWYFITRFRMRSQSRV